MPTTAFCVRAFSVHRAVGALRRAGLLCVASLLCALVCAGCVRQREAGSAADVHILRSGELSRVERADVPSRIYVDVRDMTGRALRLPANAARDFKSTQFSLADSPSQAGYILQVSLLDEGVVSPAALEALVRAGYGAPARFSGTGAAGLLADVLLVQRVVPSHRRPSRARLKNITSRNAVGSSQMRLGLYVDHETPPHNSLPVYFADALARELSAAISPLATGATQGGATQDGAAGTQPDARRDVQSDAQAAVAGQPGN